MWSVAEEYFVSGAILEMGLEKDSIVTAVFMDNHLLITGDSVGLITVRLRRNGELLYHLNKLKTINATSGYQNTFYCAPHGCRGIGHGSVNRQSH